VMRIASSTNAMSTTYIKSNGGTGVTWVTRGEPGETQRLSRPPAEYLQLLHYDWFQADTTSLVVFGSDDGRCCVLVDNVFNGKHAGAAVVMESCLIAGANDQPGADARRVALAFLEAVPCEQASVQLATTMDTLAPIFAAVSRERGSVSVDWSQLDHAIQNLAPPDRTRRPDSPIDGRHEPAVSALLRTTTRVSAGTVLLAISASGTNLLDSGESLDGGAGLPRPVGPEAEIPITESRPSCIARWSPTIYVGICAGILVAAYLTLQRMRRR
jgi:hypothetical protein